MDADKAVELLKSGEWDKLFIEVHSKMKRLEEKLEAPSEKELKLQSKIAF